jgi:hypothetical protein
VRFATVGVGAWFGYRDRIPTREDARTDEKAYNSLIGNSQKGTAFLTLIHRKHCEIRLL